MDNIFEIQRRLHEEIEALERAATDILVDLQNNGASKTRKEMAYAEHRVRKLVEDIQHKSTKLLELYEDADGSRKDMLRGVTCGEDFSEFYNRLDVHSRYFKQNPYQMAEIPDITYANEEPGYAHGKLLVDFTDEEGYGKYLDLHQLHNQYQNLGFVEKIPYLHYLKAFDRFDSIPVHKKTSQQYRSYLDNLLGYLKSFYTRALPLQDLEGELWKADKSFEESWEEGTLPGWENANEDDDTPANLFCVACQHQFAKATVFKAHLTGKKTLEGSRKTNSIGECTDYRCEGRKEEARRSRESKT
eukprot:comp22316_c0_seq1/m.33155 comp22316_c0_seq1/g.33155  ORF comp22316_c0_seq1/g.33155 comp22316_c0_seq1/m.33155 type:complete len:302 (-) comp22316_c0_seq1:706-1611(-)